MRKSAESILNESIKNGFLSMYNDKRLLVPFLIMIVMSSLLLLSFYANISVGSFVSTRSLALNYYTVAGLTNFMPIYMFLITLIIFGAVTVYAVSLTISLYMNKMDKKTIPRPLLHSIKVYPLLFWSGLIKWVFIFASSFALVIPSIFLFIKLSMSAQEVVSNKKGPLLALKSSYLLTSRRFWEVFGIVSALIAVYIGLNILLNMFSLSLYASTIGSSVIFSFLFIFFVSCSTHYFVLLRKYAV